MSEESIKSELENHPELSPILEVDSSGNVACLGWVSPVYSWEDVENFCLRYLGEKS